MDIPSEAVAHCTCLSRINTMTWPRCRCTGSRRSIPESVAQSFAILILHFYWKLWRNDLAHLSTNVGKLIKKLLKITRKFRKFDKIEKNENKSFVIFYVHTSIKNLFRVEKNKHEHQLRIKRISIVPKHFSYKET